MIAPLFGFGKVDFLFYSQNTLSVSIIISLMGIAELVWPLLPVTHHTAILERLATILARASRALMRMFVICYNFQQFVETIGIGEQPGCCLN